MYLYLISVFYVEKFSEFCVGEDSIGFPVSKPYTATKGVNPGGDGGDVSPPCFDMGGKHVFYPPHVLTLKSVVFLAWKINNIL